MRAHASQNLDALRIRPYQISDRERVKDLTIEGFAGVAIEHLIEQHWPGAAASSWGERKFLDVDADLSAHPDTCFVAELDGGIVGYITTVITDAKRQGQIRDIAVDAALRGAGIGRRLIETALWLFRSRGVKIARIETLSHNAIGAHLYPAVGFRLIATQNHYALEMDEYVAPT
jgi:ribosomal protein S18 acetylase RimI-like enzyme